MVTSPPDIDLTDAVASTVTGEIMDVSGPVAVPNFVVPASPQGAPIRVFVVHNARIQKLVVGTSPNDYTPGPAIAIVATGDVMVTGLLQVLPSAGSLSTPGCAGASGLYAKDCLDVVSGAGGGAHATNGAKGGDVAGHVGGGPGIASGTMSLQPLRGGCSGGGTDGPAGNYYDGGFGGGAVQVSSMSEIVIDGIIDAKGQDGVSDRYGQENGFFITGGGAGGGVLLEAPTVTLDINGQLLASGGGGAGLCSTATSYCGLFGLGAHTSTAAQAGGNATCDGVHFTSAGSGGGGLGRIRVNTRDGTYSLANTAVEDGAVTTGTHATR
jgi:hypothetical protein